MIRMELLLNAGARVLRQRSPPGAAAYPFDDAMQNVYTCYCEEDDPVQSSY